MSKVGPIASVTRVTMPNAPRLTTMPSKSCCPASTRRTLPSPTTISSPVTALDKALLPSPDPWVAVAIAPATVICGSDARLCSANPSRCKNHDISPYDVPPPSVTLIPSRSMDDVGIDAVPLSRQSREGVVFSSRLGASPRTGRVVSGRKSWRAIRASGASRST
jgi:hypothetical protein